MLRRRTIYNENSVDANTLLLLHFDGNLNDSSKYGRVYSSNSMLLNSNVKKFGSGSLGVPTSAGDSVLIFPYSSDFSFGANDFTVDSWVYASTSYQWQGICGKRATQGAAGEWCCELNYGKLNFSISNTPNGGFTYNAVGSTAITADTWNHVAFVRSGSHLYGFMNGNLNLSTSLASGFTITATSIALAIGNYYTSPKDDGFRGYIDELRISNIARWTASFTPPTKAY